MSLTLIQYHVHTVLLNGSRVGGVQSVTVGKSFDTTTVTQKGLPTNIKQFYKKPSVTLNFSKFISDGHPATFSGFNLSSILYTTPPTPYTLEIGVVGGSGLLFSGVLLNSLSYNFTNQGNFTEEVGMIGHVSATTASIAAPAEETGIVKRRRDFNKAIAIPSEIAGSTLLSVTASVNINYGEFPAYGNFYTTNNKYISYPVDISCSYEVLDREYNQTRIDNVGNIVSDALTYNSIQIGGVPSINLGSQNYLSNLDRSGGDAGNSDYSILRYTYKNNNNYFTVS